MSFADLGLSPKVLKAVEESGYTTPTPIQKQAIPHVLARRDVMGLAQTGTGKTASFTLPLLTLLETGRARARMPRSLILEPTRELAMQVEESFKKYGKNHKLSVALLIGGVSFGDQDAKIMRGADVLIATPGRLLDHHERGKLLLTGIEVLIIDEADRMLDMGFIPDIEKVCKLTPFTRQTLFFSATMAPEIKKITDQFLSNPEIVEVSAPNATAGTIRQLVLKCGSKDYEKRDALRNIIREQEDLNNAIIFCNRKRDVALLHTSLVKHGFEAVALHGDMEQKNRLEALAGFKANKFKILVASDVAARGLDIPDVSHVFNFDVPYNPEDYVHRIGRTGRAGRKGVSITLATRADMEAISAIEKLVGQAVEVINVNFKAENSNENEERAPRERGKPKPSEAPAKRERSHAKKDERPARSEHKVRERPQMLEDENDDQPFMPAFLFKKAEPK